MTVTLETFTSGAINIVLTIVSIVVGVACAAGAWWLASWYKKYNEYKIVIWEKDGFGQWNENIDKGGVFVDKKTQNKRLFIKQYKVGLNADNIPYLPAKGGFMQPRKIVHLIRTGLKNFHYVRVNPQYPKVTLSVGEEDVNWAINAYERQKKLFQQSLLMQMLPYIALIATGIIIAIIFIYFFKELDSLKEFGKYMKETAEILMRMKTGVEPT